jgi:uncharacterized DUF497 family protein
VQFTWDSAKARSNFRKHGISFEEAATVFHDPLARIHEDPDHSFEERHEIITGHSTAGRLLLVSFMEHEEVVRIIGARRPDAGERQKYEENV